MKFQVPPSNPFRLSAVTSNQTNKKSNNKINKQKKIATEISIKKKKFEK